MSSLLNTIDLALDSVEEPDTSALPDCDTEFQHFSETVGQLEDCEPLSLCLTPPETGQSKRLVN